MLQILAAERSQRLRRQLRFAFIFNHPSHSIADTARAAHRDCQLRLLVPRSTPPFSPLRCPCRQAQRGWHHTALQLRQDGTLVMGNAPPTLSKEQGGGKEQEYSVTARM